MATRDVRDIMGLPSVGSDAPKPPVARKPKSQSAFRQKGINRELIALHGERAPPVSIIDSGKQYRAKIHRDFKPSSWENVAFSNQARKDDLQLRHWRKRRPALAIAAVNRDDEDVKMAVDPLPEKDYEFAKYNLDITIPSYTDEQYETHLKSSNWTKDETDYLLDIVKQYSQRWPLIIDRYDYQPPQPFSDDIESKQEDTTTEPDSTALIKASDTVVPTPRKLEDLKSRYYKVWANSISLSVEGPQNMSEAEFSLHESLLKYNPSREETRKELVWQLAKRATDDVREEEFLLSELQRIMISAQKFEVERKEVRERLEMAPQTNAGGTAASNGTSTYVGASSSALNQLYAQLAAQDRTRKQRHRLSLNTGDAGNSTAGPLTGNTPNTAATSAGGAGASARRESVSGNAANAQRRGTAAAIQPPSRTLSPRREARFGVSSHDRLTSGVSFRSDKLLKLRQAKSQIQTQKIAAALTELRVPEILVLPTTRVCDAFEQLVGRITKLIEARKVLEKEESELRVKAQIKEEVSGEVEKKEEEGEGVAKVAEEEEEDEDEEEKEQAENDAEGEEDDDQADGRDDDDDDDEDNNEDEDGEDAEGEAESNPDPDVTTLSQDVENEDEDQEDPEDEESAAPEAGAELDSSDLEEIEDEDEAEADADPDEEQEDQEGEEEEQDEGEDEDDDDTAEAKADPRPVSSTRGHKRGVSELSDVSSKASRSSKRTRR